MNDESGKGRPEFKGRRVVSGILRSTKGGQLVVDGVFLVFGTAEELREAGRAYLGKEIRAEGDCYVRQCDPEEQSPEEGYFEYLSNLEVGEAR
jgi:hypothetical protein